MRWLYLDRNDHRFELSTHSSSMRIPSYQRNTSQPRRVPFRESPSASRLPIDYPGDRHHCSVWLGLGTACTLVCTAYPARGLGILLHRVNECSEFSSHRSVPEPACYCSCSFEPGSVLAWGCVSGCLAIPAFRYGLGLVLLLFRFGTCSCLTIATGGILVWDEVAQREERRDKRYFYTCRGG